MAFNKTDRDGAPMRRRGGMHRRKKVCVFCGKDNTIDYKDVNKSLREEKFFQEELQETVQNIREL